MLARDIMTQPVVAVRLNTGIAEAGRLLTRLGYTALPVVDDDNRPVGIVTEHDLLRDRVPHDPRLHPELQQRQADAAVSTVMSVPIESVTPGADVADIAEMMVRERIRTMTVVDGGRLTGIITRRDILKAAVGRTDDDLANAVREALAALENPADPSAASPGGCSLVRPDRRAGFGTRTRRPG